MTLRRLLILTLVLAAAVVGVGSGATAAVAATPCWKQLINDWYDGRIDRSYPAHCYREAMDNLPEDVEAYSTAREDMERALLAAVRGNEGEYEPNLPVPPGPGKGSEPVEPTETDGGTEDDDDVQAAPPLPGSGGDDEGGVLEIFRPSSADEIPVPLLVLGGLAVLLLAAAGASFVARKVQARRGFEGGPPLP